MEKFFNVTGSCNSQRHYMVDISHKFAQIMRMIERGEYFAINCPRQYGKTTMLDYIATHLRCDQEFVLVRMSFEGIGDLIFADEYTFCQRFVNIFAGSIEVFYPTEAVFVREKGGEVGDFEALSRFITDFILQVKRQVVLLIDEVDKCSESQIFLSFLGMLREKYLKCNAEEDVAFQAVILAGVHDVKSLKLKMRSGDNGKLNSPWNIAADFNVDMSFSIAEIKTMLEAYVADRGLSMDCEALAERIWYYSSGYPFLVSKLCKIIDEERLEFKTEYDPRCWLLEDIDWAFCHLTRENYTTTNFDDLVKNLENNQELFNLVDAILFNGTDSIISFSLKNPLVNLGVLYGILGETDGRTVIHNRIYEQILSDYMRSKKETSLSSISFNGYSERCEKTAGQLDMKQTLLNFQAFMQEHYSVNDSTFIEREGRLLFMSYLKPIINGNGFMWKEPVVGDERRMDIVVTYGTRQKIVVELKLWRGEEYHQRGLEQLADYLDFQNIADGYMLIFDFRQSKVYRSEQLKFKDKNIFVVWL